MLTRIAKLLRHFPYPSLQRYSAMVCVNKIIYVNLNGEAKATQIHRCNVT